MGVTRAITVIIKDGAISTERSGIGKPKFWRHEFARLLVLLQDHGSSRHALFKSCSAELKRTESNTRVRRESFWGTIEHRFNDHQVECKEDFTGLLEKFHSNYPHLVERPLSSLKKHLFQWSSSFIFLYDTWSALRQNDPKRITAFLELSSNGNYTTK